MQNFLGKFQLSLLCFCVFFTPLLFLPFLYDKFRLGKLFLVITCSVIFLAISAIKLIKSGISSAFNNPLLLPLCGLNLAFFISWLLHPSRAVNLYSFLVFVLLSIMVPAIGAAIKGKNPKRLIIYFLLLSALINSLYAIIQFYGKDPLFIPKRIEFSRRFVATGFFGEPTLFAGFLSVIIPLTFVAIFNQRLGIMRIFGTFTLITSVIAIFCTHTRVALLGLMFALLFQFILLFFWHSEIIRREWQILVSLFLSLFFIIFSYLISNPAISEKVKKAFYFTGGNIYRMFYWNVAIEMIKDHPFVGVGIGNFKYCYFDYHAKLLKNLRKNLVPDYKHLVHQTHNEYLQVAAEVGMPGLFFALWLLFSSFFYGGIKLSKLKDSEDRIILISVISSFFALLLNAFFSFPFQIAPTALIGIICVGFILSPY